MSTKKSESKYTVFVSDTNKNPSERGKYEPAFRRWVVREIEAGRLTVSQAIERFNINPENGASLIYGWRKKYASDIVVSLPVMTEKEKQKLESLQKQVKQMEKQLELVQMKNIALETLIDVAEEQLKIVIRKKPGPKQ